MKYALGNMLNGAGGLNPDGLSLDLQFAADKTLTSRKGPTPVFTRASTATFIGSNGLIQSAALNAARFDHDPVTGLCKGLLIEESRTNICLQSENLATTWSGSGRTISSDFATSPDGLTTADKLVENTASTLHGVTQTPSTVIGSTYIGSAYIKAAGRNFAMIYTGANPANGRYISIPADGTGAVLGLYNANPSTVTLQYVGNGWYRVSILIVSTGVGSSLEIYASTNGTIASYTGDGSSGILVWGAQLELGSFPTSYIPTTTVSVVRSADVCSITGSSFTGFYNQSEGTLLVSAFTPASGDRTIVASDDNTANEMIRLRTEGTNPLFKVTDGGSELVAIDSGGVVANSVFKLSGAYKLNDFASSVNGGSSVTDITGTIPTVDRMRIGAGQSGNTMCGCVSSLRYYGKRLSNTKIQALTV